MQRRCSPTWRGSTEKSSACDLASHPVRNRQGSFGRSRGFDPTGGQWSGRYPKLASIALTSLAAVGAEGAAISSRFAMGVHRGSRRCRRSEVVRCAIQTSTTSSHFERKALLRRPDRIRSPSCLRDRPGRPGAAWPPCTAAVSSRHRRHRPRLRSLAAIGIRCCLRPFRVAAAVPSFVVGVGDCGCEFNQLANGCPRGFRPPIAAWVRIIAISSASNRPGLRRILSGTATFPTSCSGAAGRCRRRVAD